MNFAVLQVEGDQLQRPFGSVHLHGQNTELSIWVHLGLPAWAGK